MGGRTGVWLVWGLVLGCDPPKNEPSGSETGTIPSPDSGETADCSRYEFDGSTYNCENIDRCDFSSENMPALLACCDCDPVFCDLPGLEICPDGGGNEFPSFAESCMQCHNGAFDRDDYSGPGIENPHWTDNVAAQFLSCTSCHGGDGTTASATQAHVPPPPEIGDEAVRAADPTARFAYLTRTGIERFPDYEVDGRVFSALDYLRFRDPGDGRVVAAGEGCGMTGCHSDLAGWFARSMPATSAGIFSTFAHATGAPSAVAESEGLYAGTAADLAIGAAEDPTWVYDPARIGAVGRVVAPDEAALFGAPGVYDDPIYASAALPAQRDADGRVIEGSALHTLALEAVSIGCGGCHTGSAGRNDRAGEYRGAGCSSCHVRYALDGRYEGSDPNLPSAEPADPDRPSGTERPHAATHRMLSGARWVQTPAGPELVPGIDDAVCNGCHMGSNHTVLQYWGIRVDRGADVAGGTQYPAAPASWSNASGDERLFDFSAANSTFAGLTAERLLSFEDYDGDGRDDTPPDIHHEAGLGCIDCHGARDLHGGITWSDTPGSQRTDPTSGALWSRDDQAVAITCVSCHGIPETTALAIDCVDYGGAAATCASDRLGNPLRNVTLDANGDWWLSSRLDGALHYVPQTRDRAVDTGKIHPVTGEPLYREAASFAMGRADGVPGTGTGPMQADPALYAIGFSHLDRLDCAACHASWTQTCAGCHLELSHDDDPDHYLFSNLTGERIALAVTSGEVVYSSPVFASLAVGPSGRIAQGSPGRGLFLRYVDLDGVRSEPIAFGDRNGRGAVARDDLPATSHGSITAHSIRGRVTPQAEGTRQCVACHLDTAQMARDGEAYAAFYAAMAAGDRSGLDYELLSTVIGRNPGNQLDSPYYVHMMAGLGTGLLQFDAQGCPTNPLDTRADRAGCDGTAPADRFASAVPALDLDGLVEPSGRSNAASARPLRDVAAGSPLRAGDDLPGLAGPLGADLLERLAHPTLGLVLDTWRDADGDPAGSAP